MNHNSALQHFFFKGKKKLQEGRRARLNRVWVSGCHMASGVPWDREPWGVSRGPGPIPPPWPGAGQPGIQSGQPGGQSGQSHPWASLRVSRPEGMGWRDSEPHRAGTMGAAGSSPASQSCGSETFPENASLASAGISSSPCFGSQDDVSTAFNMD